MKPLWIVTKRSGDKSEIQSRYVWDIYINKKDMHLFKTREVNEYFLLH